MFVLAHVSDIHLAPLPTPRLSELISKRGLGYINWLRKRRAIHRADVLATVVADLKAQSPDHIAVTGDLINLSLSNEFAPALAWLETLGLSAICQRHPGQSRRLRAGAPRTLAVEQWGGYMRGDLGESFPYVRKRGPLALIGLSTSLPTAPLSATGLLFGDQIERLAELLPRLKRAQAFRVVLIHHPPTEGAHHFRRLTNAGALRDVLREHGTELVLHGHHHEASLHWLPGPQSRVPVIGVPSASGAPGRAHDEPAGYNLYAIEGAWGAWRCTLIRRSLRDNGMAEIERQILFA